MTTEENARNRQTPTYARRGSPLTCFGVNQSATRLYFIGADSSLKQLTMTANGWETSQIFTSMPETPLTCLASTELILACFTKRRISVSGR